MTRRLAALALLAFFCGAAEAATPVLRLQDTANQPVQIVMAKAEATVVIFISAVCPVSNAYHDRYQRMASDYKDRGVQFVFVNSNDNETLAEVKEHMRAAEFSFPVYKDWKNVVADKLRASMTPEAFLLNRKGEVIYHGAVDDSKNEARVKVEALRDAINATLAGKSASRNELKAFGCTIHRYRKAS